MDIEKREPVMNQNILDILYSQHDFIISMYEFHPEEFDILSDEERRLLGDVYFMGREVDVDSVDEHIKQNVEQNPDAASKLNGAVAKIADRLQLADERKRELIIDDNRLFRGGTAGSRH